MGYVLSMVSLKNELSLEKKQKSRNGDTLGPVELIVWLEQGNQGDWREQDG